MTCRIGIFAPSKKSDQSAKWRVVVSIIATALGPVNAGIGAVVWHAGLPGFEFAGAVIVFWCLVIIASKLGHLAARRAAATASKMIAVQQKEAEGAAPQIPTLLN